MPTIFYVPEPFQECFSFNGSNMVVDKRVLEKAHYMMRPLVLRRLKTEVEQLLPPKLETLVRCPLTDMQRFWIKNLLLNDSAAISKAGGEQTSASEWKRLQSLLMQLRKAGNHPYLFPGAEDLSEGLDANESIVTASGKMVVLDKLLKQLFAANQ